MTQIIGPHLKSLILNLQAYKTVVCLGHKLPVCQAQGEQIIEAFNQDFYRHGDLIDSYLARFLDALNIPKHLVLRHICGEQVLKYLLNEIDEIRTIQVLLYLKKLYQEQPENFKSVQIFFKLI